MNKVFSKSNLKAIREYKCITIKDLSRHSYISEEKIRNFEDGRENIDLESLMKLCNALGCSKEDLNRADKLERLKTNIFFRNQGYINKKEELSYVQRCKMVYRIYNFLRYYLKLPKLEDMNFNKSNIEEVALKLRNQWDIDNEPICHMVGLLESKGFIVCNVNPGKQKVEAFSQVLELEDNKAYIISIGNDNKSAARRNYDLAYELGHCILHSDIDMSKVSKNEFNKLQEEAMEFAGEFLLPKESFMNDLIYPNELEFYIELKNKYIVPIKLLIKRAYDLGAISSRKYEYFIKEMKQQGWDKKEPLDSNIKISNPVLMKMCIELLLDKNIMSKSSLMENLRSYGVFVDSYEIESLLGMKKGSLYSEVSTKKSNILTLKR